MPDSVRRDRRAAEALSRPSPALFPPGPRRAGEQQVNAGLRGGLHDGRCAHIFVMYRFDTSVWPTRHVCLVDHCRAVTGRQEAGAAMSASRSGTLELAVLGLLHETPLHGYELRKRLNSLLGTFRAWGYGSLYPCLKDLLAQGLIAEESPADADADQARLTGQDRPRPGQARPRPG